MTDDIPAPGTRSEGQTFLVGPNFYVRPVELEDAATAPVWRGRPFPAPAEVVEEKLKERLEVDDGDEEMENQLLIACRRDNDQPVGSIELEMDGWRFGELRFTIDPLATQARQSEIIAELIGMFVPWMLGERNLMTVGVWSLAERTAVERQVGALSGRTAFQFRETVLVDGKHQDAVFYQFFNPVWLEKLSLPAEPQMGPFEREVRSPARRSLKVSELDRPAGAMMVGEQVYLRSFQPGEGKLVAKWAMQDPEVYYPEGRLIFNPHTYDHVHKAMAEKDLPTHVRFAIVLRETDELIGANGISGINWVHQNAETETEIYRAEHRGAGHGTEAKHLLLEYAFERLGLHMIYSYVGETNPRSAAALRKQGYRDAGYIGWDSFAPEGLCGYWAFDLLASEWRAARDAASKERD
jgi:RimJ/RimL family protein N-acetyltransferase